MTRGVLFDLDGTLADTERLHWSAYRHVLLELGVDVGLEEYRRHFILRGGGPDYACAAYRLPIGPDELKARKALPYRALLRDGPIRPLPGAREMLERLHGGHRLAVATNSVRDEAELILGALDFDGLLDAVVAREDYELAKPRPDAYLAAAAALGLAPAECVVVEDTPRGLEAGLAAGMWVVVVPTDLTADGDFTGATCRLGGLEELTPELLAGLDGAR
jgi:HAD superfamily hydrolase (TIGR01509 family)